MSIDREIMGTPEAAKADLIAKAKVWRATRQPLVTSRAEHRKAEASEHEARFQLANAALHWLWHEENPPDNFLTGPFDHGTDRMTGTQRELTQPEKLGRHIIEQYLDGREVMDSLQMSMDILTKLGNGSLEIARSPLESDWNAAVEECARYAESRFPPGVNDSLAASLREFKRGEGK